MPITDTQPSIKQAIRKFWGTRPCGLIHSSNPADSHAFFTETEAYRFRVHTDWDKPFLRDAIGFAAHTGKLILEIGCGIGVDSLEWARAGNRVVALDYNMPSCRITRDRFGDADAAGVFLNGDAENLPFPAGSFDIIYSFGVLHHTPGTEKAISEVFRCLRPGGQAIIMLYYKWSAMVLGNILLGYGFRQGALWRLRSVADLISQYTEWDSQTDSNINPLTKVYSKREIRRMFRQFASVGMELHYLWPGHFGPLRRLMPLLPYAVQSRLHRLFGWNVIIKAEK